MRVPTIKSPLGLFGVCIAATLTLLLQTAPTSEQRFDAVTCSDEPASCPPEPIGSSSLKNSRGWSPDGSRLVFFLPWHAESASERDLFVVDRDGSGLRNLTCNGVEDGNPAWSPDGKWIAYFTNIDGHLQLARIRSDGTGLRILTSGDHHSHSPEWSPDGEQVLFESNRDGAWDLYLIHRDGGVPLRLTRTPAREGRPSWSSRPERIVFYSDADGDPDLYVMGRYDLQPEKLTDHSGADYNPSWESGDDILFVSDRDGDDEIHRLTSTGAIEQLTRNRASEWNPYASPDGGTISFYSDQDGGEGLWLMDADGSNLRRLVSPDAVLEARRACRPANLDDDPADHPKEPRSGSVPPRVAELPGEDADADEPLDALAFSGFPCVTPGTGGVHFESSSAEWSWSPRGNSVVFDRAIGDASQLRTIRIETRQETCLTSAEHYDSQPSWSPDGSQIAFVRGREDAARIRLLSLEDGSTAALTGSSSREEYPALSPDGARIAFVRFAADDDRRRFAVVRDLATGKETIVFDSPFGLNNLGWTPGGDAVLLYSIDDDGWNDLYEAAIDGSGVRRLTDNTVTDSYSADYSPDGKKLLFGQGSEPSPFHRWFNYDLYEKDLPTGAVRRLTWAFGPDDRGRYSPDGETIGFVTRRSGYPEIALIDAEGTNLRILTQQPARELGGLVAREGFDAAVATFRRQREADAEARLFSQRGAAMLVHRTLAEGSVDDAVRIARLGVATYPESHWAHTAHGRALLAAERPRDAEDAFRRSLALFPNQHQIAFELGIDGLLRVLDSIDGIYRDQGPEVYHLARWLRRHGALRANLELLRRLDGAHPDDADVTASLAHTHLAMGNHRLAITGFRRSLELDPGREDARFHLPRIDGLSAGDDGRTAGSLEWAEILQQDADPEIIHDVALRDRIAASGLPWRVRDRRSGVELLLVLPGEYLRGAAPDDPYDRVNERPQHEVVLTRPFYLGRFELTNAEMRRFVAHDSGQFPRDERLTLDGDRQPAVAVSWEEAMGFAAYFGLRLPTEAEWEYAARAGVTTRYPWGNDIRKGARMGNVFNESMKVRLPEMDWPAFPWDDGFVATAPVGSFPPNEWGFHDMFGNVWEWVADSFDDGLYARLPPRVTDPLHDSGGRRTLRGGGFGNAPRGSGIPYRYGMPPHSRHFGNGFRVARWP